MKKRMHSEKKHPMPSESNTHQSSRPLSALQLPRSQALAAAEASMEVSEEASAVASARASAEVSVEASARASVEASVGASARASAISLPTLSSRRLLGKLL